MSTIPTTTRQRVLQALGAGTAALLGCDGAPGAPPEPRNGRDHGIFKPGSRAVATQHAEVPGPIKPVDHALSRIARKGMLAVIQREGEANQEVFDPEP